MTRRRAFPSDRIALVAALAWAGIWSLAPSAKADDWGKLAAISSTMGVQANRLCVGEATRGDLGCPATAPSLTTAGDVSVTGNLSAQKFIGDGSGLTGLVAGAADRITSGTTSLVATSATGVIAITQNNGSTGWFDPVTGLVTLGISTTGPISATGAYIRNAVKFATNAGIQADLVAVTNGLMFNRADGQNALIKFDLVAGTGKNGIVLSSAGQLGWGSIGADSNPDVGLKRLSANTLALGNGAAYPSINATGILIAGGIGLGTATPTATLQVSGTLTVSNSSQLTTPTLFIGSSPLVGFGTNAPTAYLHVATTSATTGLLLDYTTAAAYDGTASLMTIMRAGSPRYTIAPGTLGGLGGLIISTSLPLTINGTGASGLAGLGLAAGGTVHLFVGSGSNTSESIRIQQVNTAKTALGIYGVAGATANLQEWRDSNSNTLAWVDKSGNIGTSGTISATHFVGDGSGLTGITVANDNIVSGSARVTANRNTGISATADVEVSGSLKLATSNDPSGGCNSAADHGKLKWENGMLLVCK